LSGENEIRPIRAFMRRPPRLVSDAIPVPATGQPKWFRR
jgi:hypothetical protein